MHISDVEKYRMEKDHQMRHGYKVHDNNVFPHNVEVKEHQPIFKEYENKHARESRPSDYEMSMEIGQ